MPIDIDQIIEQLQIDILLDNPSSRGELIEISQNIRQDLRNIAQELLQFIETNQIQIRRIDPQQCPG